MVRDIDDQTLVPDVSKTIDEGAVAPWGRFGLAVMPQVVAEFGVRTDVPYRELTDHEREIVLGGPAEKRRIRVPSKSGKLFDLNFTYRSARQAVRESMNNATSEKGLARVNRFITTHPCPACPGTRLSAGPAQPGDRCRPGGGEREDLRRDSEMGPHDPVHPSRRYALDG